MAKSNRLAEVCSMLAERDEEFLPIRQAASVRDDGSGEQLWPLSSLVAALALRKQASIENAINRAKIAAAKAEMSLKEHFQSGSLYDNAGEVYLSKYAAYLFVFNCDPSEGNVGVAQVFFALQVDKQQLEDEKRLRTRFDVATENNKLAGVAKECGVENFERFNGMGVKGLYGGLTVAQIKVRKGLPASVNHLDFAGSEELAANLFRITQTRAALARQGYKSEALACETHYQVAEGVREAITKAGNTLPEKLPASALKIDAVATQTRRLLKSNG